VAAPSSTLRAKALTHFAASQAMVRLSSAFHEGARSNALGVRPERPLHGKRGGEADRPEMADLGLIANGRGSTAGAVSCFDAPTNPRPRAAPPSVNRWETRTLAELHHRYLAGPKGPHRRTRRSCPCASLLHPSTLSAYSASPFCPVPSTIGWSAAVSVTAWPIKVAGDIGRNMESGAVTNSGVFGLENSGEYRLAIGRGA
jgi:hypothetical protein